MPKCPKCGSKEVTVKSSTTWKKYRNVTMPKITVRYTCNNKECGHKWEKR